MPITYDIKTDYLFLEGKIEGKIEGEHKKAIIGIINMLKKQFSTDLIAELLKEKQSFVLQVQEELKQEKKIIARLKKKQKPKKIAALLKVSEVMVVVLQELEEEKRDEI